MGFIKGIFNPVADPRLFFLQALGSLVVMILKREFLASKAAGYGMQSDRFDGHDVSDVTANVRAHRRAQHIPLQTPACRARPRAAWG